MPRSEIANEHEAKLLKSRKLKMPDRLRWDRHFITLALENARMSKDPATQAGAVIVGPDREVRSMGYNGLPRGIADTP